MNVFEALFYDHKNVDWSLKICEGLNWPVRNTWPAPLWSAHAIFFLIISQLTSSTINPFALSQVVYDTINFKNLFSNIFLRYSHSKFLHNISCRSCTYVTFLAKPFVHYCFLIHKGSNFLPRPLMGIVLELPRSFRPLQVKRGAQCPLYSPQTCAG